MTAEITADNAMWTEIEAISDKIRRALECPICLQLVPDMKCSCLNGHHVCNMCAVEMSKRKIMNRCPMCRSPMPPNVSSRISVATVKLAQITAVLKVACAYRRFGCNALIVVQNMTSHEQLCPYKPTVQCKVSGCQWLGVYNQLFDHVRGFHPNAVINTTNTSLIMEDVNSITHNRRQTYLVNALHGTFWVLLSRASRNRIYTTISEVRRNTRPETDMAPSTNCDIRYRIKWMDAEGNTRGRNRLRNINQWIPGAHSSGSSLSDIYSIVRSDSGRIMIGWSVIKKSWSSTLSQAHAINYQT